MIPYFKPWLSDEEPKVPKDWGLSVCRTGRLSYKCRECKDFITYGQQYLYSYPKGGTIVRHNTKQCVKDLEKVQTE